MISHWLHEGVLEYLITEGASSNVIHVPSVDIVAISMVNFFLFYIRHSIYFKKYSLDSTKVKFPLNHAATLKSELNLAPIMY